MNLMDAGLDSVGFCSCLNPDPANMKTLNFKHVNKPSEINGVSHRLKIKHVLKSFAESGGFAQNRSFIFLSWYYKIII